MSFVFKNNISNVRKELRKVILKVDNDMMEILRSEIGKQGVRELSREAPRSKDRAKIHLNKSFFFKKQRKNIVAFFSKVPYAKMVSEGTGPSKGGYLPALGRRLKKRTVNRRNITSQKLREHPGVRKTNYIKRASRNLSRKLSNSLIRALRNKGFIDRSNSIK